jgi:hypothetical protein
MVSPDGFIFSHFERKRVGWQEFGVQWCVNLAFIGHLITQFLFLPETDDTSGRGTWDFIAQIAFLGLF